MSTIRYYFSITRKTGRFINSWDLLALFIIFGVFFALTWGAKQMATPYQLGTPLTISLHPAHLPQYATRTILRMGIALLFSLLFTFTVGTWAAKNKRAGALIIPAIDILQSVPVLSFLSITIGAFIYLFPHSLLGPECASIFAIFTAQAWNMALGFYQTLRTIPHDLKEAADVFQLSAWQRFWRIEVPFSTSSLLWNMMMSMSASWFFVVASEAISVSNQSILLPGIGSYIAVAIANANMQAVFYAIITMFIVILFYDQLIFRPLITWSEKFKMDQTPNEKSPRSWFVSLLQRTHLIRYANRYLGKWVDFFLGLNWLKHKARPFNKKTQSKANWLYWLWNSTLISVLIALAGTLIYFIHQHLSNQEIEHVFFLGLATSLRVFVLIVLSSIVWVPIGVWIGRRPAATQIAQPFIQFLASFPANLLFPLVVMSIVRYQLNVEIWTTPLMILGSQWYILFNVIAGASSLPKDLYYAADNFNVRGWQWWKRLALPGIFPYYVTGAMAAAGGAWNASIVAEWVRWGDTTLRATGLGAYIAAYTRSGDFYRIALGTSMMCLFVLVFNRLLWQPLFRLAEERFHID